MKLQKHLLLRKLFEKVAFVWEVVSAVIVAPSFLDKECLSFAVSEDSLSAVWWDLK